MSQRRLIQFTVFNAHPLAIPVHSRRGIFPLSAAAIHDPCASLAPNFHFEFIIIMCIHQQYSTTLRNSAWRPQAEILICNNVGADRRRMIQQKSTGINHKNGTTTYSTKQFADHSIPAADLIWTLRADGRISNDAQHI